MIADHTSSEDSADVERELRDPTRPARISALNLAEVVDVMARIYRRSHAETMDALILLASGGFQIAVIAADIGTSAGKLHARHYDRKTSPLSMADCVALATAAALGEPLAMSDPPLAAAARLEVVTVIPLPDASGRPQTRDHDRGVTIPIAQLAELAGAWWGDRLAPDWQQHTREQNQAILDRLGLTGPFWRLG